MEQADFRTSPPESEEPSTGDWDDAIAEIQEAVAELTDRPEELLALCGPTLDELAGKLPAPLRNGDEPLNLRSSEFLNEMLARALPLLKETSRAAEVRP